MPEPVPHPPSITDPAPDPDGTYDASPQRPVGSHGPTSTGPPTPQTPTPEPPAREPVLGLSMTQVVGGSAAAATAAALGSRLGVVGTVVGAALLSVITAVAGAVYSRSLQRTKEVVARAGERLPTVRIPAQRSPGSPRDVTPAAGGDPERRTTSGWWQRVRWRPVAVSAVVVFLLAGGIVTGFEQLTGRSLDGTGRTSVGHIVAHDTTTTSSNRGSDESGTNGSRPQRPGSDDTGSDPDQGSGTPATEQPSSTPTPTAEPSDGATDGSDSGGSTTPGPTPQPSAPATAQPTG